MFVSGESSYQFFGGEAVLWTLLFIKKKKITTKTREKNSLKLYLFNANYYYYIFSQLLLAQRHN